MENFNNEKSKNRLEEDFQRLKSIAEILKEIGLRVVDDLITVDMLQGPGSEVGFPIVRDGLDGIRASYSQRGGLRIWFTNGFENPGDPKRREVEKRLSEAGLI